MRFFFFSSRRRHTRYWRDWSSDVCSSDLFQLSSGMFSKFMPHTPARNVSGMKIVDTMVRRFIISFIRKSLLEIRSEEHTSELQSRQYLVCRLLLEKKKHA